ncbi:MAG: protein-(glutamine-N5) methyltransferase, release factor-specific [Acidiferrobacteraceae bacterium]|nr:protein-(glutamine-N5) methyltransferase, release factor-specific [Acidiferrobacteraceae bacterium]|tara:strand:- start:115 stop:963 length:849 start_codon:yes stop_codon:yes gene_type:complete
MTLPTVNMWVDYASDHLSSVTTTPHLDAEIILRNVCGIDQITVLTGAPIILNSEQLKKLEKLLNRRHAGEPIAYIIGEKEFWSLPLKVTKDTLIPRPETELLVEFVIDKLKTDDLLQILDLGTGSGAIAIALATEFPKAQITATDISLKALEVAKKNAKKYNTHNVTFKSGDWLNAVPNRFYSIIVCNPPYVGINDPDLDVGQTKFEPDLALFSTNNGMSALQKIIAEAPKSLQSNGWLVLEHGHRQQESVKKLLYDAQFKSIVHHYDLSGRPRVTAAQTTN